MNKKEPKLLFQYKTETGFGTTEFYSHTDYNFLGEVMRFSVKYGVIIGTTVGEPKSHHEWTLQDFWIETRGGKVLPTIVQ